MSTDSKHFSTCSINGCDNPHKARGWCRAHYLRWYKTGDPLGIRPGRWDGYERPECGVGWCDELAHAKGFCAAHYARLKRHGDPEGGRRYLATGSDHERFREFLGDSVDGCWLWVGATTTAGYPEFQVNGETTYAHRWSYEQFVEEIPEGLVVDHLCGKRSCVNPNHLDAVTHKENIQRGGLPHFDVVR